MYHCASVIEAKLWEVTQLSAQARVNGVSPDKPIDKVIIDSTSGTTDVFFRSSAKTGCFNFAGKVSLEPSAGSLWVCRVIDIDYYVSGEGCLGRQIQGNTLRLSRGQVHCARLSFRFVSRLHFDRAVTALVFLSPTSLRYNSALCTLMVPAWRIKEQKETPAHKVPALLLVEDKVPAHPDTTFQHLQSDCPSVVGGFSSNRKREHVFVLGVGAT